MGAKDDTSLDIAGVSRPVIILARPQMGENIGACARAMKNCGVYDLRLIAPRDGWPNPLARPMATVATDILDSATVYDRLADALDDVGLLLATTARLRDMEKPVMNPRQALAHALSLPALNQDGKHRIALLFGAERSGLDNDEVALADMIVQADLNPESRSLNIAQAVFMMCWEWRMAALEQGDNHEADEWPELATLEERDFFFRRLESLLDEKGFFATKEMAPIVKRNMRSFFTRAAPTKQEMRTWQGILTKLERS